MLEKLKVRGGFKKTLTSRKRQQRIWWHRSQTRRKRYGLSSTFSVGLPPGGSGLCDRSRSALRQGPQCEVRPGPGPGGGRPRAGLLPPHDQRRHHGAAPGRPAALPQGDGPRTRPGELRVGLKPEQPAAVKLGPGNKPYEFCFKDSFRRIANDGTGAVCGFVLHITRCCGQNNSFRLITNTSLYWQVIITIYGII